MTASLPISQASDHPTTVDSAGGDSGYHLPVLPAEVVAALAPAPGKIILDGTLGGGGHTLLLLQAGAQVIGLDQDLDALKHANERLKPYALTGQFRSFQSNFRDFPRIMEEAGIASLDGLLVDLGVSSYQLNEASRGFSFMHDGPLDMRMNACEGPTAADLVNEGEVSELERILWEYGEERQSRRIVRALVERRQVRPFTTTSDLASAIEAVVPRRGKTHPATLTFQGLRIAVNDELAALADFLHAAPAALNTGGRLGVISFHSLEDRMVKQALQKLSTEWLDRPEWPEPRRNPEHCLKLLHRKPLEATGEELKRNPRARSAKLRSAEKLPR
ncbi:MAG: 16S rRNA (cytosine(1402)-N(4))-methyltransferase RsmH [Verrucomicrobium sp.]